MLHKQRFTNVTLITPLGEFKKDLLIQGDKIIDIIEKDHDTSENWKIIDCNDNYIFPGMIDVLQHG